MSGGQGEDRRYFNKIILQNKRKSIDNKRGQRYNKSKANDSEVKI